MDAAERVERLRSRVVEEPNVVKALVAIAAPIIAARLLTSTYEAVDTIFLGRVGAAELATPTSVWPLLMLLNSLVFGVNTATVAVVSQLVGARRYLEASEEAGRFLGLSLALAVAGGLSLAAAAPVVFRFQELPPSVYPLAVGYATIQAVGVPFMYLSFYFTSTASALGDTRTPFYIIALSNLINIALDPLYIFGYGPIPSMGVVGAALATVHAKVVAGSLALYLLANGRLGFRVTPRRPRVGTVKTAARIGGPVTLQQLLVSSGFIVMISIVARLGDVVMAAYNVSLSVIHLFQIGTMGFTMAIATMVGQSLGAGKVERAVEAAYKGLAVVFASLAAAAAVVYAFRVQLVHVFTSIPEVAEESVRMIELITPGIPFLGLLFAANGVARGSGHTMLPAVIGAARLWAVRIPLAYMLAFKAGMGADGVWIAMTVSNIAAGLAGLAWVASRRWARGIVETRGGPRARLRDAGIERPAAKGGAPRSRH